MAVEERTGFDAPQPANRVNRVNSFPISLVGRGFLVEGNIQKKNHNKEQRIQKRYVVCNRCYVNHGSSPPPENASR